jgi:hypothetical protein
MTPLALSSYTRGNKDSSYFSRVPEQIRLKYMPRLNPLRLLTCLTMLRQSTWHLPHELGLGGFELAHMNRRAWIILVVIFEREADLDTTYVVSRTAARVVEVRAMFENAGKITEILNSLVYSLVVVMVVVVVEFFLLFYKETVQ